jgi:hypothetical protein
MGSDRGGKALTLTKIPNPYPLAQTLKHIRDTLLPWCIRSKPLTTLTALHLTLTPKPNLHPQPLTITPNLNLNLKL